MRVLFTFFFSPFSALLGQVYSPMFLQKGIFSVTGHPFSGST